MRRDLIDVLITDHDELRGWFAELEDPHVAPDRARELVEVVTAELVRHSVAEEAFLYPAAREALRDGDTLVDRELADHAKVEEMLKRLEDLPVHDTAFFRTTTELIAEVRHHLEEEETVLFPQLRLGCDPEELVKLGGRAEAIKKIGPTRPHPGNPDTPPWNLLLAPGTGLVDRVRDYLQQRPTTEDDLTDSNR